VGVTGAGGARIRILGRMCRLWGRDMEREGLLVGCNGFALANESPFAWMDGCLSVPI